jgi:hypothetical protein
MFCHHLSSIKILAQNEMFANEPSEELGYTRVLKWLHV